MAWELDIADLKKLCSNSLEYCSLSEEDKNDLRPIFEFKWQKFIEYVKGRY